MHTRTTATLLVACAALFSAGAHAQTVKTQDGMLVNSAGMTLYTFDKDTEGKSACYDQCAKAWPPLTASANAQAQDNLSVITRDDGTKQWAYRGKPLYLFVKDTKPGDKAGDNVKQVWHIVTP